MCSECDAKGKVKKGEREVFQQIQRCAMQNRENACVRQQHASRSMYAQAVESELA